ncbi:uncharacterized protein LOC116259950 [Nymphaea colorata]|uniref:uncharacterized protein LOC116259950 n=1 Tax=Nymphaea colorata TaxID=210225 RepID=UPI00129DB4D3|nr:uncharacterized protein LOC116259950 [Nymphaea colorata]
MAVALRHAFLRNFIWAIKLYGLGFRDMTMLERGVAIKRAADIAMASASGAAIWNDSLINSISRVYQEGNIMKSCGMLDNGRSVMARSKKIGKNRVLRRYGIHQRKQSSRRIYTAVTTERETSKRIKELRSIVPGGRFADTTSLLSKTANYILFLEAQVSAMNHAASVFESLRDQDRKHTSTVRAS